MRLLTNLIIWTSSFVITVASATFIIPSVFGIIIGAIIWLIVFSKTLKHFIVSVGNNEGWVIFDPIFRLQSELSSGYHCKFFWEKIYQRVDLRKEIYTMKHLASESYTSKSGLKVEVKWNILIWPQQGNLIKYVAYKEGDSGFSEDDPAIKRVRSEVSAFLNGYIEKREDTELIGGVAKNHPVGFKEIREEFKELFKNHPIGEQFGIGMGNPEIFDIDRDPEAQKARATKGKVDSLNEAVTSLIEKSKLIDPTNPLSYREALDIAQMEHETRKSTNVKYEGLPPGMKTFIAGGNPN